MAQRTEQQANDIVSAWKEYDANATIDASHDTKYLKRWIIQIVQKDFTSADIERLTHILLYEDYHWYIAISPLAPKFLTLYIL